MTVFLGLELDEGAFLADEAASLGRKICGPSEFLFLLEIKIRCFYLRNDYSRNR